LLRLAQEVCQKCEPSQTQDLLSDIYYALGSAANETNDGESCLKYNQAFLKIRKEIAKKAGTEDIRLGVAHNQIGTGWIMANDLTRAEETFKKAMAIYRALPELPLNLMTLAMANLGLVYWMQGCNDLAAAILEQGLRDRESSLGIMDKQSFQ
jgi:hypothetical protein